MAEEGAQDARAAAFRALIERSSLGTKGAKRLRQRTTSRQVDAVRRRVERADAEAREAAELEDSKRLHTLEVAMEDPYVPRAELPDSLAVRGSATSHVITDDVRSSDAKAIIEVVRILWGYQPTVAEPGLSPALRRRVREARGTEVIRSLPQASYSRASLVHPRPTAAGIELHPFFDDDYADSRPPITARSLNDGVSAQRVMELLDGLPDREHAIALLVLFLGLTIDEVAVGLALEPSDVSASLARAQTVLAQPLQDEGTASGDS